MPVLLRAAISDLERHYPESFDEGTFIPASPACLPETKSARTSGVMIYMYMY